MDYVIIGLLILVIILVVISLTKNINEGNITERLGRFETNITKEIGDFKNDFSRNLTKDFTDLNDKIEDRLIKINDKVNNRLDENFEKTNKTFASVLERLSKIDEAQKKIDTLSGDIISLQNVLTDKKSRGTFGEVNLNNILSSVFGDNNTKVYELQHKFDNGNIADAVLYAPEPLGLVAIDSKFPLENYQNMVDKNISKIEREIYEKKFKSDLLIDESLDIIECCKKIKIVKLNYKIIVEDKISLMTREEVKMIGFVKRELNNIEDIDKIKYLYYECFNRIENNIIKMNIELEKYMYKNPSKLFNILMLSYSKH